MDFALSEEQQALRDSLREFLTGEASLSLARRVSEGVVASDGSDWKRFADLGWVGLMVPSALGGAGLGHVEMVLALEEAGAVVLPGAFLPTLCLGVPAFLRHGTDEQKRDWLSKLATGERTLSAAWCEADGRWGLEGIETAAWCEADGRFRLKGRKLFVPEAESVDAVLVPARLDDGYAIFCVPARAKGVSLRRMNTVDRTRRLSELELDLEIDESGMLGGAPLGAADLEALLAVAKTGVAAEMAGAARRAVELSVDYAKIRHQFSRPIGSFQAVQHKCADMHVAVENTRSLVYYAAWALDEASERAVTAAAMAKAYAGDACMRVVSDAVQVHGGIGFTWEHDLHLYFKRVKCGELSYGDAVSNREIVARSLALG